MNQQPTQPMQVPDLSVPPRRRNPLRTCLIALVVLLVIFAIGLVLLGPVIGNIYSNIIYEI